MSKSEVSVIITLTKNACFVFNNTATEKENGMPEICRFFGIVISMFHKDHNPPHFHARYGNHKISINILDFSILGGYLPPRTFGLVMEWATLHKDELLKNWEASEQKKLLTKIEPLK